MKNAPERFDPVVGDVADKEKGLSRDAMNKMKGDRKAPPEQVKRIFLGTCSLTLKQWPSDGSHSIEVSQKDFDTGQYANIAFPVHLAPSVISALSSLSALGLRRESEG